MIIERIRKNGERYVPHRFNDGFFRVADPKRGPQKHHSQNQILVREDEILDYLRRGFDLRIKGETTGQSNLIAAKNIVIR